MVYVIGQNVETWLWNFACQWRSKPFNHAHSQEQFLNVMKNI